MMELYEWYPTNIISVHLRPTRPVMGDGGISLLHYVGMMRYDNADGMTVYVQDVFIGLDGTLLSPITIKADV